MRAATTISAALAPSTTNDFSPCKVQPPAPRRASSSMPPASQRPFGSATASVASVSPAAIPGSSADFSDSLPAFKTAFAASATDAKYGAHSSARPISSRAIPSSTKPRPWPPYDSGMCTPGRPSSWLSCFQTPGS